MDDRWKSFFEKFPETVTTEQLPVKLPRFDLDLCDLAGAAADWCHQYLKDRKCPSDLVVFLTQKVINNLRVKWAAEPTSFGYRPEKQDYQALWLMQRVIGELNDVCLNHTTTIPNHQPILTPVWWSSFVLKNIRRQMEDYIAVVPYLHKLFDIENFGDASFYAVYDGHNGLDAAVYSSMYLHQFLVQSDHYPTNPELALYESFFATDKGFTTKTEKYNLVSGTTAVCTLLRPQENKLYVGWVGDSIATLWKNGTPLCLVNKHVPDRHDEAQRIENEGGMISQCQGIWRVDGQLAVSRAIGDVRYKPHITCQPELRVLVLDGNEEFLVLGSDGLWEDTTPEDVAETIYDELFETDGDVSGVSKKLAFKSKALGSKDNISVITVFLQDPKQLVAKRRAAIMETAMEQRNASATLASYGQDTGDFGPETDVDTPDEPVGLNKPKVEGEANVVDESGEDSEEDGGGWNYYNKPTEGIEKKIHKEEDNNHTGTNSDAEDMDYKLNPDAPEFVPVASPTLPTMNQAQRFLNMNDDDFISSSPQKFKESIDNVVVPDENDFTNEIKVHAADLSKLNSAYEPNEDSAMLNGIHSLNDEVTNHNESSFDSFVVQNEHISNGDLDTYQNPFLSDEKVDLNKVQDLSEYLNDNAQSYNADPYASIMETTKNNEIDMASGVNEFQNESDIQLNDGSSMGEHIKYEQDMNSKNIDETISTVNATVGSSLQFDDNSFTRSDDYKNEFTDNHTDKFGLNEDQKLNDSVSTTDAVLGSEPCTPMRMDNQSTFESENDDDQFSETFKQQIQFNQFDENNDKENHDPFCFEQTNDPEGIIPNVSHEVHEATVDETLDNDDSVKPDDSSNGDKVSELTKHEPIEEPLCIKEKAKPIHSAYEQQYLPESDFSASTHEALLNANDVELNHHENDINTASFEQHGITENYDENKLVSAEHKNVDEHSEHFNLEPKIPTYSDDVKQDSFNINEQENSSIDSVKHESEKLEPEISDVYDEQKYVEDSKQDHVDDYLQNRVEDYDHHNLDIESSHIEHTDQELNNGADFVQDDNTDFKKDNCDIAAVQNHAENYDPEFQNNYDEIKPYNVDDSKHDQFNDEAILNDKENSVEIAHNEVEEFEQKYHDYVSESVENHVQDLQQEHHDNVEVKNNFIDNFKQEHSDVKTESNNINEEFKQNHKDITEIDQNQNGEFHQEAQVELVQNHITDSDEEMHSSMIIHSDVENNTPQPYCSVSDTLVNEPDMMCTSMTFEENFQNRNMSDSLYVMETSSDYFGEEVQPSSQLEKSIDEPKVEELLSNIDNGPVEPVKIDVNEIVNEAKPELVSETKIDESKAEIAEAIQSSSEDPVEKINEPEENNKVSEIAVAAAVGAAAVAAVTGVSLASKKSAPKKVDSSVSKTKTPPTKTTSTKAPSSKPLAPVLKKTLSSTSSKPLSRPSTAPSTSKAPTNVRSSTVPKTATLKATTVTVTKASPKPAPKTSLTATRPTSAKTTPTTPRTSTLTKTTPTSSPKTPTTPKTPVASKSATTPKTNSLPRTSTLVNKQPLTNGSPKPSSRPVSAPAKKPLSSVTTNGTTKLTNGDVSKTSSTTKPPVTLATRMSLAPPKLPPKAKTTTKTTVTPPAMPGPIRRPNKAPTTKKTETATS